MCECTYVCTTRFLVFRRNFSSGLLLQHYFTIFFSPLSKEFRNILLALGFRTIVFDLKQISWSCKKYKKKKKEFDAVRFLLLTRKIWNKIFRENASGHGVNVLCCLLLMLMIEQTVHRKTGWMAVQRGSRKILYWKKIREIRNHSIGVT